MIADVSISTYGEALRLEHLERGIIFIDDEIHEGTCGEIMKEISYLTFSKKYDRIDVRLSSGGGDAYSSLGIYDALRLSGKEVVVTGTGMVASAAAQIILQAGDVRRLTMNGTLMFHEVGSWEAGVVQQSNKEDLVLQTGKVQERIFRIMANRSGQTLEQIKDLVERKEVYLSAEEALEGGFIDEIVK